MKKSIFVSISILVATLEMAAQLLIDRTALDTRPSQIEGYSCQNDYSSFPQLQLYNITQQGASLSSPDHNDWPISIGSNFIRQGQWDLLRF